MEDISVSAGNKAENNRRTAWWRRSGRARGSV